MSNKPNDITIPVLWFTAQGMGPSELALQLHPFPSEMEGRIPAALGIRVRSAPDGLVFVSDMVGGGFNLHRDQVAELHKQLGEWLAANAAREPGDGYCECGERLDKEHSHGNE